MRPDLIILPTFSAPVQDTCSFRALPACHISQSLTSVHLVLSVTSVVTAHCHLALQYSSQGFTKALKSVSGWRELGEDTKFCNSLLLDSSMLQ